MALDDTKDLRAALAVVRPVETLRAQAVDRLRKAIMEGQIPAGARLVERKLCDLLGVSRTLVREGLRQLEAEGWVCNTPYKGPKVATITAEEARQIYEIRAALEGLAAQRCAERASPAQLAELSRTVDAMGQAQRRQDLNGQLEQVERFYQVMLAASGNELLSAYLASQRSRLALLRRISLSQPKRALVSVEEKRRILAAICARDGAAARAACETHIQEAAAAAAGAIDPAPAGAAPRTAAEDTGRPAGAPRRPGRRSGTVSQVAIRARTGL